MCSKSARLRNDSDPYAAEEEKTREQLTGTKRELTMAITILTEILNDLHAPQLFCEQGFVEKCRKESPKLLPLLGQYCNNPWPPTEGPWTDSVMRDLLGIPGTKPSSDIYSCAKDYFILRQLVELSGGDPGPNVLDELGLQAIKQSFECEDAGQERRSG